MPLTYNTNAPRRPVNLTANSDLVKKATYQTCLNNL